MDEKALRKVREKLEKAIAAGRDDIAIPLLSELVRAEPTNARWPHKQGDLLRRAGRTPEAVEAYVIAVDTYARTGFIARAVAMAKTVLSLDPKRVDVLARVDPNAAQALHRQARPASLIPAAAARTTTQQGTRAHHAILTDDEPPARPTRQGGGGPPARPTDMGSQPKIGLRHPMVLDEVPEEPTLAPEPQHHPMLLEEDAADDIPQIVDDGDPVQPQEPASVPQRHPMVLEDDALPPPAAPQPMAAAKAPTGPQPRLKLDDAAKSALARPGAGPPKPPAGSQPRLKLDDEALSALASSSASGASSGGSDAARPPKAPTGPQPRLKLDDEAKSALSSGGSGSGLLKGPPKIPTGPQPLVPPPPKSPTGSQPKVRPAAGSSPAVVPPPRAAAASPATISLDEDLFTQAAGPAAAVARPGPAAAPPPPPQAALRGRPAPPTAAQPRRPVTLDRLSLPPPKLTGDAARAPAAKAPERPPPPRPAAKEMPAPVAKAATVGKAVAAAKPAAAPASAGKPPGGPAKPRHDSVADEAELFSRALEAAVELAVAPDAAPNETRFSNAPPSAALELSTAEVSRRPEVARDEARDAVPRSAGQLSHLPLFPLFAEVPQDVLVEMVEQTELIELDDGDYVVRRGDPGDALYGIVEGSVAVVTPNQTLELTLAEGDVFGESCLLKDEPRHADVRVKGRLTALRVPREALMQMLGRCPQLAELILDLLTRRLLGNLLQSSPLFQEFDAESRRELSRLFEVRRAAEGTQLAVAGKKMDGLYISLTGTLLVEMPGGEPRIAPAGSMFGQHTLLSQKPSPWTVTARVHLVVLRLPAATFTRMAMQYPTVLDHLAELSTGDVVSVTV